MAVILSPRPPVILASEPGRYEDDEMIQKRLFSDDEDAHNTLDYQDRREHVMRINTSHNVIKEEQGMPARQAPSYMARQGR